MSQSRHMQIHILRVAPLNIAEQNLQEHQEAVAKAEDICDGFSTQKGAIPSYYLRAF
jgi:hypothetical protein